MDTGELIAILIVVIVLLVGSLIIGVRCCRSVCALLRESSSPQDTKFSTSVRERLRRSIRRMSFNRRGNSFRQKKEEPVAKVATIEELHRERSELHPKYQPKLIPREEGDGAVDTEATATASIPDCTVHFMHQNVPGPDSHQQDATTTTITTTKCTEINMIDEIKCQVEQERFVRSDPLPSIDISNESSTDTTPMTTRNHGNSGMPVSSHQVELNLLETGDGFSNPGYESGSMLDLVTHVDEEDGGFENPGYLVIGTPEPCRSKHTGSNPTDPNKEQEQCAVERPAKSLAEDFKDIQIQSKCLIDLDGETDVDRLGEDAINSTDIKHSGSGVILAVSKPFTRGAVNRASIGALKSRPGKLSEDNIKRITVEDKTDPDSEDTSTAASDRYYQPPVRNAMYPERTHVDEEEAEQAPTYVHACYELTGTGVIFSDEDTNALTSDSFI